MLKIRLINTEITEETRRFMVEIGDGERKCQINN